VRHTLFWIVFFSINFLSVGRYLHTSNAIISFVGYSVINMMVFYSGYALYLGTKRFNSILLFVAGSLVGPPVFFSWLAIRWYFFMSGDSFELIRYFNFYGIYIFISSLAAALKFGKDLYVWQQEEFLRKQEQAESELNFLKAQISPHFLFNTLNNLYGHAVTKSDLLPDMMLRLADLLRYTIYETSKPFVPLHDELDYIRNYVALEKIRLSKDSNVNFDLPQNVDVSLQIAPLLLISFVENAFKHSRHTIGSQLYIKGTLTIEGKKLRMQIENSYNPEIKEENLVKREGGVGLDNLRKRLQMLYPNKHQLRMEGNNGIYKLNFQIDL
jgi:two-component system sensor histidine kinase LytS